MAINVIVFGNVPLASWVIGEILKSKSLNLIGVVAESCPKDQYIHHASALPPAYYYCTEFNVPILTFEDAKSFAEKNTTLGISVRYNKIFREDYFSQFKLGIINLHGGELPKYRGSNIANYVILNNESRIGGTLHFISSGIDEGDISIRKTKDIVSSESTAFTVFKQTIELLKEAFKSLIKSIETEGVIPRTPQHVFISNGEEAATYRSNELEALREISKDDLKNGTYKTKVRAFHFPGHEPAYIKVDGKKVLLVIEDK
ncbi:MAG: formyltransferase family protein [Christensenellales bacterium]|jgi:methionyl-tRNA formyltransferase